MKILGTIAEYNPIHNGHIYHLNKSKEITGTDFFVAVMSGNFTQRGEPAIWDKWTRAKMAVDSGVDLVLELPTYAASASAELFAKTGIEMLNSLGIITDFTFGSEVGSIDELKEISDLLVIENDSYKLILKDELDKGHRYAKAREIAVTKILGKEKAKIINQPNNILGIEYLKALRICDKKDDITPMTIKRYMADYHSDKLVTEKKIASAKAIRAGLIKGNFDETQNFLAKEAVLTAKVNGFQMLSNDNELLFKIVKKDILTTSAEELSHFRGMNEGLENKIKKEIRSSESIEELVNKVVSKRYTKTGMSRLLLNCMLKIKKEECFSPYLRVLACNEKGQEILRTIKKEERNTLPIITNINKEQDKLNDTEKTSLKLDILAADVYNLLIGKKIELHSDYKVKPYIKK
ncbi:MAG: nucleotidyltransferase [Anaerovoracaceae bacterium]